MQSLYYHIDKYFKQIESKYLKLDTVLLPFYGVPIYGYIDEIISIPLLR